MRSFALLAVICSLIAPAHADPRIRDVAYAPDQIIRLVGHYGYQTAIQFPENDRIESVAVGDSITWQVTANKRGNVLFIKPVDEGDPTNMTVLTTGGYYTFELTSRRRTDETPVSEITYLLRISTPSEAKAEKPAPAREPSALPERAAMNTRYTYKGSRQNLPSRVYDDGTSTTFEWPPGIETPAIFYRRADGGESIVNFSNRGDAIVVHQIAPEFILRNGKEVTQIFNDGFVEADRGPAAPQPRGKEKKGGLFGLFKG